MIERPTAELPRSIATASDTTVNHLTTGTNMENPPIEVHGPAHGHVLNKKQKLNTKQLQNATYTHNSGKMSQEIENVQSENEDNYATCKNGWSNERILFDNIGNNKHSAPCIRIGI